MRLGIDFGTTNSAVAYFDGQDLYAVEIDSSTETPNILPSLIYIDRAQYDTFVGVRAMREYARRETGRPVKWQKKYIGEFQVMVGGPGSGPITFMQDAYVMVDEAAMGRLLQSVKTALRDGSYQGTMIFERFYTLDQLLVILLRALKESAEHHFGQDCTEVVLGRPVRFSNDRVLDRRAEEILYKAARWAGFERINFQLEPIGAAYLHHAGNQVRQRVLVFDFGGGTLDFTIADVGGGMTPSVLATHGVLVGGDDLDRRIMQYLLKYFGAGAKFRNQPFPYEILDKLLNWQTMPDVTRPEYQDVLYDFRTKGNKRRAIEALETLVSNKLGFALFKEIERVKKSLSAELFALLKFRHDPIRIEEAITRTQFENMIRDEVRRVEEGLDEVLAKAEMAPGDIDIVLRTGGSSQIPIFIDMLVDRFGADKVVEMHPLASIVGGLAIIAHEGRGDDPTYTSRYLEADELDHLITDIQVETGQAYETYLIQTREFCYTDQESLLTRVPVELSRLPAIRTFQADYEVDSETHLRFELTAPATVYIAYTMQATELPHWLRFFADTGQMIETWNDWFGMRRYAIYRRDFPAGTVSLGGARAPGYWGNVSLNYLVIVQAVS